MRKSLFAEGFLSQTDLQRISTFSALLPFTSIVCSMILGLTLACSFIILKNL
jgi:hypothetical protein